MRSVKLTGEGRGRNCFTIKVSVQPIDFLLRCSQQDHLLFVKILGWYI